MAIIYQTDKRVGITYAYENKAYWDKEKKQSRAKRELIGRVDHGTGEIIPTDGRHRKASADESTAKNADYKKRYEELQKKYTAMETLNAALQMEINELRGKSRHD
jgi:hypothetical protein